MRKKIATAVGIVAALFASFGGFLTNVSPPEVPGLGVDPRFAVGLASMAALIVLLIVQAVAAKFAPKGNVAIVWLLLGAFSGLSFVIVALNYNQQLEIRSF